jgi:hypothetical protein
VWIKDLYIVHPQEHECCLHCAKALWAEHEDGSPSFRNEPDGFIHGRSWSQMYITNMDQPLTARASPCEDNNECHVSIFYFIRTGINPSCSMLKPWG